MKRPKFTPQQTADILKELEEGKSVAEIRSRLGVCQTTLYNWRRKYKGLDATQIQRIKELEEERCRQRAEKADQDLDDKLAKEVSGKKALLAWQKKQLAQELCREHGVSISRACRALNLNRSVFYYVSGKDDRPVIAALRQKTEAHPQEGFWKIHERLRQEGHSWNHKKVHRVYKEMALAIRGREKSKLPLRVSHMLQHQTPPNHSWTMDFTTFVFRNASSYSFHVTDEHSREVMLVGSGLRLRTERVLLGLDKLVRDRGKPARVRIEDQPMLVHSAVEEWGQANGVEIIFLQHCELHTVAQTGGVGALLRNSELTLKRYRRYGVEESADLVEMVKYDYNCSRQAMLGFLCPIVFYLVPLVRKMRMLNLGNHYYAPHHSTE